MIVFKSEHAANVAATLAKGSYQQSLVNGLARWSGSDLRGKARQYGSRYRDSRMALLQRMLDSGLKCTDSTIDRKRVLIVE